MKKLLAALAAFSAISCTVTEPGESRIFFGVYSLVEEKVASGKREMHFKQCLTVLDLMNKRPNELVLQAPASDSIYEYTECMDIYKKGECYIADQGIFGTSQCFPGTFTDKNN